MRGSVSHTAITVSVPGHSQANCHFHLHTLALMPAWTPQSCSTAIPDHPTARSRRDGDVFLGRDTLLERLVAVKFIAAPDPTERHPAALPPRGRAIARPSHPNVVCIYRREADGHPYPRVGVRPWLGEA